MTEIGTKVAANAAVEALKLALDEVTTAMADADSKVQALATDLDDAENEFDHLEAQHAALGEALRVMEERSKA